MRYGISFPARPIIKRARYYIAPPTNFAATVSSGYVTLTWTDNAPANTSYRLERKLGSGAYSTLTEAISGSAETYADPELLRYDKTYTYRLTALYSYTLGESESVTVTISIPPFAHSNLQAFPSSDVTGNISVQLLWDKNARYDEGTLIERSTDNLAWSTIATTDKGATTYEDTGLTVNTLYYYRVTAIGNLANSATTSTSVTTKVNTTSGLSYSFLKKVRGFPRE